MDRNIALELVRITETAALASANYMGRGDKNAADGAAVEGMRVCFESVDVRGEIVIGEGELDEAPMLYIGERVGSGYGPMVDIAVDPIDGTNLIAKGLPNAISVIAMTEHGKMLKAPDTYMDKIIVGPKAKGVINLDAPVSENLKKVAAAIDKPLSDLTLTILDRPRHEAIIKEARETGVRIKMFNEGDVAAGIATCFPDTGVDILLGAGGAPEGVITAAAVRTLDGDMQGRLRPMSPEEIERCHQMGFKTDEEIGRLLNLDDLVSGKDILFAATAITDGDLLNGITFLSNRRVKTHSVVMRSSTGTIRFVEAMHNLDQKEILKRFNL